MNEYLPLLIAGAAIGICTAVLLFFYLLVRKKKAPEDEDLQHDLKSSFILKRILKYAKPYWKTYLGIFFIILLAISYDAVSPVIFGWIEELIKSGGFELSALYAGLAVFVSTLLVSVVATYLQAVLLQKTGQKIISAIREELFIHIESLSHEQLHHIPVGKLVTRETNDTNALSRLFTEIVTTFARSVRRPVDSENFWIVVT